MTRRKLGRKAGGRQLVRRSILVCYDGEVTEDIYFRGWRQIIPPSVLQIEPVYVKSGGNPLKAVKQTIRISKMNRSDYAEVWCVSDVDDATSQVVANAVTEANRYGIQLALSKRCFELWIMLHFGVHTRAWNNEDEAISDVRMHFEKFGNPRKEVPFADLYPNTATAITNAASLRAQHLHNPATDVDKLVAKLQKMVPV